MVRITFAIAFLAIIACASAGVFKNHQLQLVTSSSSISAAALLSTTPLLSGSVTFLSQLQGIAYTATDAVIVDGYAYIPYGAAGVSTPDKWNAMTILGIYDVQSKSLVKELTLADWPDYSSFSVGRTYLAHSRTSGFPSLYLPSLYPTIRGFVDIFPKAPSAFTATERLFSIELGSTQRPYLRSVLQPMIAGGFSEDGRYVFYNYVSGNATDIASLKVLRMGIIDAQLGNIVVEVDVPNSYHHYLELSMLYHGGRFIHQKKNKHVIIASYYTTSLSPLVSPITQNRLLVIEFDQQLKTLIVKNSAVLPSHGIAFDAAKNSKYIVVGCSATGSTTLKQTPTAPYPAAQNLEHNLRVYQFNPNSYVLSYKDGSRLETDITQIHFSPDKSKMVLSSALLTDANGHKTSSSLSLFTVKSSGSQFQLEDTKANCPYGYTATWDGNNHIWTAGQPSLEINNVAVWEVV